MKIQVLSLAILFLTVSACTTRHTAYTLAGSAAGAGVGYSYNHSDKEAAIGGLIGGVTGAVVGEIEHRNSKKKHAKGYEEGYSQAQVDIAQEYWNQTTGKKSSQINKSPKLKAFKVPSRKEGGVAYDSHYVVLEDYR